MTEYSRPYINKEDGDRKREEENHHILAKSQWGTNQKENRIKLYSPVHFALHRLFGNWTPIDQLHQLLTINGKALTDEFKKDILTILKESDKEYYYKNGIYIKNNY